MTAALLQDLAEARRDALVAHYLHTVIPKNVPTYKDKILTADDLYEFLLLDTQVSAHIKTSRIAEAIASVQLYLHRCREGLEPEVNAAALATLMKPGGYLAYWDAYNKRYGTWAGLQRLLRYPASYIDPSLRYEKTDLFVKFEDELNQGRLTQPRAESAFTNLTKGIVDALRIDYVDGFQSTDSDEGPMYFLGESQKNPGKYYWRQTLAKTDGNPLSWTAWKPVEASMELSLRRPSIVFFANKVRVTGVRMVLSDTPIEIIEVDEGEGEGEGAGETVKKPTSTPYFVIATLETDGHWGVREYPLMAGDGEKISSLEWMYVSTFLDAKKKEHMVAILSDTSPSTESKGTVFVFDDLLRSSSTLASFNPSKLRTPGYSNRLIRQKIVKLSPSAGCEFIKISGNISAKTDFSKTTTSYTLNISDDNPTTIGIFIRVSDSNGLVVEEKVSSHECEVSRSLPDSHENIAVGGVIRSTFEQATFQVVRSYTTNVYEERDHPNWSTIQGAEAGGWAYLDRMGTSREGPWLASFASPFLEDRLRQGLDVLLGYETQTTDIEPIPSQLGNLPKHISFEGGVGVYTWDLFFHAPFLIACRLLDEQRFDEAEQWLRRLFNPAGYVDADGKPLKDSKGSPRYWNVRPLQEDIAWNTTIPTGTDDPDVVAMADPMHYKLAVYLRWMKLLLDRGDAAYRKQTRDTLTEAKMWYVQASQMLGRKPYFHTQLGDAWKNPTLGSAATTTNPALDALDLLTEPSNLMLPATIPGQVQVVDGPFFPPVDTGTLVWWERFTQRLYNLRHGLSLDGQPLLLPLYETPVDPRELQNRRQAGDAAAGGAGANVPMPAHRFVVLLERARQAVQQVMQFGGMLQGILERRDADALTILQQTQGINLLAFAEALQKLEITALEHSASSLSTSRRSAINRQAYFDRLHTENTSRKEDTSLSRRSNAIPLLHASTGGSVAGAALDMVPNTYIFGLANGVGGTSFGAVAQAIAMGLQTEASAQESTANRDDISEGYRRRREEWGQQRDQAVFDIEQIDAQIAATAIQLTSARKQTEYREVEHAYAQAVLDMLGTRFTAQALFNWQAGRMSTLYYQLYDASMGLCASAQKSFAFETGDTSTYLQPGAWDDVHQGLLAGESLMLGLQRLEHAYLAWDKRTLEVERTLSLGSLSTKTLSERIANVLDATSIAADDPLQVSYENDVLTLMFPLAAAKLTEDYPSTLQLGETRRIKSIAVTLPALLGPYEDVRAILAYSGAYAASLADGCTAVAISRGLADSGQFILDFNDGKHLPFEGIPIDDKGMLSLRFPNAEERLQDDMLRSITDVILHIRYTIRKKTGS